MYPEGADDRAKKFFQDTFMYELAHQCDFALISMAYLRFALNTRNLKLVFYSSHAFLTHAGNISKLLWPDKRTRNDWPKSYNRGSELRRILKIPENSPLKDRTLRNHLEHYDSRIDEWVLTSQRHNYVDQFLGPISQIGGVEISDIMRHFDYNTYTLSFHGDSYDLLSTEKEIIKLLNQIMEISPEIRMTLRT